MDPPVRCFAQLCRCQGSWIRGAAATRGVDRGRNAEFLLRSGLGHHALCFAADGGPSCRLRDVDEHHGERISCSLAKHGLR